MNEPCKKCGNSYWYVKGDFSYCRVCHNDAQKRYLENKRMGIEPERKGPPSRSLETLLSKSVKLKSYCPRGHSYSGDNVRLETQVTGNLQRRCKACERDRKRVTYGLTPEPDPVRLTSLLDGTE
jgi:hypothetical protein